MLVLRSSEKTGGTEMIGAGTGGVKNKLYERNQKWRQ